MKFSMFRSLIKILKKWSRKFAQDPMLTQRQVSSFRYDKVRGSKTFYIVFRDADIEYPGISLFHPGFTHCYAISRDDLGYVAINPISFCLDVFQLNIHPDCDFAEILLESDSKLRIVEIEVNGPFKFQLIRLGLMTCVTEVNYLLGLKWPWFTCITPYQLYKRLLFSKHPNIVHAKELQKNGQETQTSQQRINQSSTSCPG